MWISITNTGPLVTLLVARYNFFPVTRSVITCVESDFIGIPNNFTDRMLGRLRVVSAAECSLLPHRHARVSISATRGLIRL